VKRDWAGWGKRDWGWAGSWVKRSLAGGRLKMDGGWVGVNRLGVGGLGLVDGCLLATLVGMSANYLFWALFVMLGLPD
jgi:hypothetical protein